MLHRTLFICNAIENCKEIANCCVHKAPHIKDERCIPRECRFAPGVESIDCDPYDPENPRAPVPQKVVTRTVEQFMKETSEKDVKLREDLMREKEQEPEHLGCDYPSSCTNRPKEGDPSCAQSNKELDIKEAVKKQAAKQSPAKKDQKKGGKKVS